MAQAVQEAMTKQVGDHEIVVEQALVDAYFGRLTRSQRLFDRAIDIVRRKDDAVTLGRFYGMRAHVESLMGESAAARRHSAMALDSPVERDTLSLAGWALARTGDVARARNVEQELLRRYPSSTIARLNAATLQATLENNAARSAEALERLKTMVPYDYASTGGTMSMYPVFVRGESYLRAGDASSAVTEFQKIVGHPGMVMNSPVGSLARLYLARAYAAAGNAEKGRAEYEAFLGLWKDADPTLPVLVEARKALAGTKIPRNRL